MTLFKTHQSLVIFRSLVQDVEELLGMERHALEQDYLVLEKSVLSRGETILLISLPELCSDLEFSLDNGRYIRRYEGPLSKLENGVPSFLRSVYLRVFSLDGVLSEDPCVVSIRCLRQLLRCFKKYDIECPPSALEMSIDKFVQIESELPIPALSWGGRDLSCDRGWPSLTDLVQRNLGRSEIAARLRGIDPNWSASRILQCATFAQRVSDSILGKFVFNFSSKPKHGPGAVSEGYRISKFEFPSWNYRLEKFFPFDEYGLINHGFVGEELEHSAFRDDVPSKLIAVPKDYKGPRLIASEPICAQYIQQLIMKDLRRNTRKSVLRNCIDFLSQIPSRELALKASQRPEDWSTIDLSSASDRLSCAVVECVFRGKFSYLEILNSARTPRIRIGPDKILDCNKFAAQGAAFTFPVQSICYAVLVMGVLLFERPYSRLTDIARSLRVYGDDIICPSSSFTDVALLLTSLDMIVNHSKSFSQGFFRESCGMDAYNGVDITPAYIRTICDRRAPTETMSAVDTANNLYLKGFFNASSALLDMIPKDVRQDIPYVSVGSGIWGIVGPNTWARKYRYNRNWQRYEARVLSLKDASSKLRPDGASRLFQWFIEEPKEDRVYDPYRIIRSRVRFSVIWIPADMLQRGPRH